MAGVVIYPSRLSNKMQIMNSKLHTLTDGVEEGIRAMGAVALSQMALKGRAWDSARSYVKEIQKPLLDTTVLWIDCQIEANNKFARAAKALPQVACLDQDALEQERDYWERKLDREYDRENPRRSNINRFKTMIRGLEQKLDAIDRFIAKTNGLYDRAMQVQDILSRADSAIKKVSYDPVGNSINFTQIDRNWVQEFANINRLVVLEKVIAEGLTEEQLKAAEQYGFSPHEVLTIWEELREQGITRADLERMEGLGFNLGDVLQIWQNTKTEEDQVLVTQLMKQNYEAAFLADPSEISPLTQLFLGEYVLQISLQENGGDQELQALMNGILKQYHEGGYQGVAGHLASNAKTMEYLKMLNASVLYTLERESMMFLDTSGLSQEQLDRLVKRNKKLMSLATMSASTHDILYREMGGGSLLPGSVADLSSITLGSLSYQQGTGTYEYQLSYQGLQRNFGSSGETAAQRIQQDLFVKTSVYQEPGEVEGQLYLESRAKLEVAKEELGAKLVTDLVSGGTIGVVGVGSPFLASSMQMFYSVMYGDYSAGLNAGYGALKADELYMGAASKEGLGVTKEYTSAWAQTTHGMVKGELSATTVTAARALIGYWSKKAGVEAQINKADMEQRLSWFGQAGTYTVDGKERMVVSGIYNPKIIERVGIWESEGLAALAEKVDKKQLFPEVIFEKREKTIQDFVETLTDNEEILWKGGGILAMETKDFEEAVKSLNDKYKSASEGDSISIKGLVIQ